MQMQNRPSADGTRAGQRPCCGLEALAVAAGQQEAAAPRIVGDSPPAARRAAAAMCSASAARAAGSGVRRHAIGASIDGSARTMMASAVSAIGVLISTVRAGTDSRSVDRAVLLLLPYRLFGGGVLSVGENPAPSVEVSVC